MLVLGGAIWQLARKHPENVSFRYFRNFALLWVICTVAIGAAETFSGQFAVVVTTLGLVIPFLYIAAVYLIRVPFALYQKEGAFSAFLAGLSVVLGVFYGLSLFIMGKGLGANTGPLEELFAYMAKEMAFLKLPNVLVFHMVTMLAIFVPVGFFFLMEAFKSKEAENRVRSILIGLGLIIAGIAEWYHVTGLHAANRDFILIFGFLLVVVGLFYPAWRAASLAEGPTTAKTS